MYYNRYDTSEGIDIDKTNVSKECDIYHYGILKIKSLSFNVMSATDVMTY